jgi:hypothetical protein
MNVEDRFDGFLVWRDLPDEARNEIGATVLELLAAWWAQEQAADPQDGSDPLMRAADAADIVLMRRLHEAMVAAVPHALLEVDGQPRLPSMLGPVCRKCGCSEDDACGSGCAWVEGEDLCSPCADAEMFDENACPGHVASAIDPKVCAHCGVHIDELRPPEDDRVPARRYPLPGSVEAGMKGGLGRDEMADPINLASSGPAPIVPREG